MSTTIDIGYTRGISESPPAWWRRMSRGLAAWRKRARGRDELARLSERQLRDIGLTRYSANFEAAKPFWRG